tara:strand:- start:680 stop:901 length:222 start_codon:yes stop_codon:yes gene_type:complete
MSNADDISDEQLVINALAFHANYIETGSALYSARDYVYKGMTAQIRHLTPDQNTLVNRLHKLWNEKKEELKNG